MSGIFFSLLLVLSQVSQAIICPRCKKTVPGGTEQTRCYECFCSLLGVGLSGYDTDHAKVGQVQNKQRLSDSSESDCEGEGSTTEKESEDSFHSCLSSPAGLNGRLSPLSEKQSCHPEQAGSPVTDFSEMEQQAKLLWEEVLAKQFANHRLVSPPCSAIESPGGGSVGAVVGVDYDPEAVLHSYYYNVAKPYLASRADDALFNKLLCENGFKCISLVLEKQIRRRSSIGASVEVVELSEQIQSSVDNIVDQLVRGNVIIEFGVQNQGRKGFGSCQAVIFYHSELAMFVLHPLYLLRGAEQQLLEREELVSRVEEAMCKAPGENATMHYFLYQPDRNKN